MRSFAVLLAGSVLVASSFVGACSGKSESGNQADDDAGAAGSDASGGSAGAGTGGTSSEGGSSGSSRGGASGSSSGGRGGVSGSSSGGSNTGGSGAGGAGGGGGEPGGVGGSGGEGGERMCSAAPVGMLCVRGTTGDEGESLAVGERLRVELRPTGCYSSSCTEPVVAQCSVMGGGFDLIVNGEFCLLSTADPGVGCTADCGGGGIASCESPELLDQGDYTVTIGALSVSFTVPTILPFGGRCDGSPF